MNAIRSINDMQEHLLQNGFVVRERVHTPHSGRRYVEVVAWKTVNKDGWRLLHSVCPSKEGGEWYVETIMVPPSTTIEAVFRSTLPHHHWGNYFEVVVLGEAKDKSDLAYRINRSVHYSKTASLERVISFVSESIAKVMKKAVEYAEESLQRESEYKQNHVDSMARKKTRVSAAKKLSAVTFEEQKKSKCAICGNRYDPNDSYTDMTICNRCDLITTTEIQSPGVIQAVIEYVDMTNGRKRRKKRTRVPREEVTERIDVKAKPKRKPKGQAKLKVVVKSSPKKKGK